MFQKLAGRKAKMLDQDKYKQFSVIAPFIQETQSFLFEVRSNNLRKQPGEICFPGGFIESGETPTQAALREASEELLIPSSHMEVVAPLDILVTPYSTMVYPFLGVLSGYSGSFNKDEVQSVFTVPFDFFVSKDPLVYFNEVYIKPDHDFPFNLITGGENYPWLQGRYPVLFYLYEDKVIWGMTARFIHNIVMLYNGM